MNPQKPHLARGEWIAATQFHDVQAGEVLRHVTDKVRARLASRQPGSKPPVVLLDLDSTLYDTSPRTHRIVHEWLEAHPADRLAPKVRELLRRAEERHVSYSLLDLFGALGLDLDDPDVKHAWSQLKEFWKPRFFSNAYLPLDRAYAGAASFVQRLYEIGATLAYLTGRDKPGMMDGTIGNLKRDGFPIEVERTHLLMKPAREGDDFEYKVGLAEHIRSLGELIASFENEPRNLMGLMQAFPDAIHVFVETVCSDHPAPCGQGLYRLREFPPLDPAK